MRDEETRLNVAASSGKQRVLARWGWAGENGAFLNILQD
jgi:hypothetical protein